MHIDIYSAAIGNGGRDLTHRGDWQHRDMPFGARNYSVFAFLAGVKNFSAIRPIVAPRGLPSEAREWSGLELGAHSFSWVTVAEMNAFDYDSEMEDRRIRQLGTHYVDPISHIPGNGVRQTWREFLTDLYFNEVAELNRIGADRVVFGFGE